MTTPRESWPIIDGVALPPESEWCRDLKEAKAGQWAVYGDQIAHIDGVTGAHGGTILAMDAKFSLDGRRRGQGNYYRTGLGPLNNTSAHAFVTARLDREARRALWNALDDAECACRAARNSDYRDHNAAQLQRAAALLREAREILEKPNA